MSSRSPPEKRRREDESRPLAITCTPCRHRKIKCDSTKPTCDNCARNPAECVYPVKLKPGLRPGTGVDMARRLEQLEDRVAAYESRLATQEAQLARLAQGGAPPSSTPAPASTSSVPPAVPVSVPLLSPDIALHASPAGGSVASFVDAHLLPPDDVVRDLISLYLTHIYPWAPIIDPLAAAAFAPPWNIVVYAIVVVSLRLSDDPRIASSKLQFRQAAKGHVLSHAVESTSVASVQALALLALDLIGSEQGPSSWGILALLTRSAVHLGLRAEDDRAGAGAAALAARLAAPSLSRTSIIPPPATWREDESRRRLFWLIFCLDRYACVSTGWEFALPDDEIRRRLPCADEIWARDEWFTTPVFRPGVGCEAVPDPSVLSPMAYLVEAIDLLGRAHTLQAQTVDPSDARQVEQRKEKTLELTATTKRWFAECPVQRWEVGSMGLVIQAIYHATLLKLNAYYAFPALSDGAPVEPFGATCLSSARALADLTTTARDAGFRHTSSPLFIWSTWVAARVLFVNDFLAHKARPDDDFETILSGLKEQSQWWSLANQYVKLLERAKRKWAHASSYDAQHNPSLPDAIHVLLDLRRTAYGAVGAGGDTAQPTPHASPPDVSLSHLPAWAVQPLLGDLHNWFDLPAGLFGDGV